MNRAGRCRSCDAPIVWAVTKAEKAMPLDLAPNPDGNVVIEDGVARVLKASEPTPDGLDRYMPHHATCPNAASWRRR